MQNKKLQGLALVVLSMIIYGLNPIFAHYLVEDINPLLLGGLSLFIASLPLLLQLSISKKIQYFHKSDFLRPLFFVVLFSTIGDMLFYVGTKLTSGVNTALLIQIEPIYSIVIAGLFLGDVIKIKQIFAILTIVLGAIVVVYKGTAPLNLGDIFIILSPLFYQCSHLNSKKIINKVPHTNLIPATRLFYGGIIMTTVALVTNPGSLHQLASLTNVSRIILFGLYLSLDLFLWYQVLRRLPLSLASAFLPFSVFVSFFGAMIFLKEPVFLTQIIGLVFIVSGLLWLGLMHVRKKTT